jgi:hypothetical protein
VQLIAGSTTSYKTITHRLLKHSKIQRFEKDFEEASTINNIWKITKRFTKHQTQRHNPVIHAKRGSPTHRWTKPHQ